MINLYRANETDYSHNEFVLDECSKCEVTEELNGTFELDLEYPVQDKKQISSNITRGAIIKCPVGDAREPQLFRIRKATRTTTRVRVYAESIAIADLRNNFVRDTNIVGKKRKDAIAQILANTSQPHNFKVGTLDTNTALDVIRIVRYSPLRAIVGDDDNTILMRYGGEVIYNNFELNVVDHRGKDNGVVISYGKNITGIEETIDDTDLATAIIPEGKDELLLPEYQIESPYINNYEKIHYKKVELNNIGIVEPKDDDPGITRDEACQKLRDAVNHMFTVDKVDIPSFNYKVNFIQLSKTEEYKDYAILENVSLGDTVTIKHLKMNIDLEGRIIKTKYNVLLNRFIEIELGFTKQGITDIINETNKQVEFMKQSIELGISNLDATMNAKIKITEDAINADVNNKVAGLETEINMTASGLETKIVDTKNELNNNIKVTASGLTAQISNAKADLHNDINVTAAGFDVKLTDAKNQLSNNISATNSGLTAKIADTKAELLNDIAVNANGFDIKLSNQKSELTNTINMTNSNLNIKIADTKSGLESLINTTAGSIRTDLTNTTNNLRATIAAQPAQIMTQVSGEVTRQLNTKTSSIQNDIDDLTDDMDNVSSKITQLSNSISSVVKEGDMASLIKQNSTAVKVAFNDINDYFQITSSGATFGDVDEGEYTKLTSSGLEHYSHGSSRPYKYLTYVGYTTIHCSGSGYTSKRISLPSYFEGTDPQVICSIKKIYDSNSGRWCAAWWSGAYAYMDGDTTLRIEAMSVFRNWSNGDVWTDGLIDVAYMVIA
jgi:phage minor structural protein